MGQRSQIYIKIKTEDKTFLIAKYYQWNFAERMISRARYGIEYIEKMKDYLSFYIKKIEKIIDINFDMFDVAESINILEDFKNSNEDLNNFNNFVFKWQDNNDGKLFIYIDNENIKYCFTDYNLKKFSSPAKYMQWDFPHWKKSKYINEEAKKTCIKNMNYIKKHATLMTDEELNDFLNDTYILPGINAPLF